MSNVSKFYRDGYIKFKVNYKPLKGVPIICVDNGKWYKFKIDKVIKLKDEEYEVISETLISIDNNKL